MRYDAKGNWKLARGFMNQRHEFHNEQNWHERGYLPHYDAAKKYQMITYRLADSLPQEVLIKQSLLSSTREAIPSRLCAYR